jgi:TonB family protein
MTCKQDRLIFPGLIIQLVLIVLYVSVAGTTKAQVPIDLRPEDKRPDNTDRRRLPEASLPCAPEEKAWWDSVRKAGDAVRRSRGGKKEREELAELLNEGSLKSYKVPVPDRRPINLNQTPPEYTNEARNKKISGTVILGAEVRADGTIGQIRVLRGLGFGLDENSAKAARKAIFLPAVKDGKFVTGHVQLEMNFNVY